MSAQERAELRNQVNRARVVREEQERRERDAAIAAEELGQPSLGELQERFGT